MTLRLTFEAETPDALHDQIAAYLGHKPDATVTLAKDVAAAAGSTAASVKPAGKPGRPTKAATEAKAAAAAETAEAETAEEADTGRTVDEVREALTTLRDKTDEDKRDTVLPEFLSKWGVKKVAALPADKYDEVYAAAKKAIDKLDI